MAALLRTLAVSFLLLGAAAVGAQTTADIQRREALRSDDRMYADFRAFAAALRAAVNGEPRMSLLEVSENTAFAIVRADDGSVRQFSWVEGKLSDPATSLRKDEATDAEAMANRFTFADVDLEHVRAALRTHRAQPGRFGDSAPELRVGYNRLTQRWLVIIQLGSLAFMGLDAIAYDLKTGAPFDLMAVVRKRNAEVEAHNRRVDEQRKANDVIRAQRQAEEERLAKIRMYPNGRPAYESLVRELGREPHLKNVVLNEVEVNLTLWDERANNMLVTYTLDRNMDLRRASEVQKDLTGCDRHYTGSEVDWEKIPFLIDVAYSVLGITPGAGVRVDVERPERCGPVQTQVSVQVGNSAVRSAWFDGAGRLVRADR